MCSKDEHKVNLEISYSEYKKASDNQISQNRLMLKVMKEHFEEMMQIRIDRGDAELKIVGD